MIKFTISMLGARVKIYDKFFLLTVFDPSALFNFNINYFVLFLQ